MTLTQVARYFRSPAVPRWRKLVGLAALVYVLMPVDLIPDVIPVFGWLDDVGVVGLALSFLTRDVRRQAQAQATVIEGQVVSRRE